ncbi:MAG: S24 family peptidase [Acidobacteriia bacterium]|nr:S24 family peptidase [Terriglobia bacterium]
MACELAREVVRTFGQVRLRVSGTSMAPSILPGDLISVQRARWGEIAPGEIVMFSQRERLFVHRVVARRVVSSVDGPEEPCLITRGDRLGHEDPPVFPSQLLGRVVSIQRGQRNVTFSSQPRGSHHPILRLLQTSDRATYFYLRIAAGWRTLFLRRAKCPA